MKLSRFVRHLACIGTALATRNRCTRKMLAACPLRPWPWSSASYPGSYGTGTGIARMQRQAKKVVGSSFPTHSPFASSASS